MRRVLGALKTERLVAHNSIVAAGTMASGLLGVAFQSLISHQLKPSDYGSVFAVISVINLIYLPATAFTLLMAREASRDRAYGRVAASATLLQRGERMLILLGAGVGVVLALISPSIGRFFAVPGQLFIVAALGVPCSLAVPLLIGEFQGEQRFGTVAAVATGLAGTKLLAAVVLGLMFGPIGVIGGVSLSSVAFYVVLRWILRSKFALRAHVPWFGPAAKYLAIVLPSSVSLAVLLSSDVLIVKHFFPSSIAGGYAAIAAVGRAIFWGASGVATVLFPKIVFRAAGGRSTSQLVVASLLFVVIGGVAGFGFLTAASKWLLTAFAGSSYAGASIYLPWYAIGMTLLGGVAVLVAAHQSHGRMSFLLVLVPLSVIEPILLTMFRATLLQLVQVLDLSAGLGLVSLGILYFTQERVQRVRTTVLSDSSYEQPAVEMVAGQ